MDHQAVHTLAVAQNIFCLSSIESVERIFTKPFFVHNMKAPFCNQQRYCNTESRPITSRMKIWTTTAKRQRLQKMGFDILSKKAVHPIKIHPAEWPWVAISVDCTNHGLQAHLKIYLASECSSAETAFPQQKN